MKKLICYFAFTCLCEINSYAQSLERQVIGSSGDYTTAMWGSLSSTTGETMTNTLTAASIVLTQGFQQPEQSDLGVKNIYCGSSLIQAYPNPAWDKINVVINMGNSIKKYTVALIDILGQKLNVPSEIMNNGGKSLLFIFDIQKLACANYFIVINGDNGEMIKTFKFTKTKLTF